MGVEGEDLVVPTDDHISTTIAGEAIILHLDSGTYFGTDGVGARIWELVESEPTVAEIEAAILAEFDVGRERVERDVRAFVAELESAKLVTIENDE